MSIADEHVDHWYKHGYVVIPELFDAATVQAARDDAHRYFPPWEEFAAHKPRYAPLVGQFAHRNFPFQGSALNQLAVHPYLCEFAERVMGIDTLFMTQSVLWAKYAGEVDYDQDLHADYLNNTLLWPRDDGPYLQLPMIVYLTDVTIDHGPTYVLSKQHDDLSRQIGRRPREKFPEIYDHEVPVVAPAGSVLIHTMRTLHRGSAMKTAEGMRLTLHMVYRGAGNEFMSWSNWPLSASIPEMIQFLTVATPKQRAMIGIPLPGDPYWNEESVRKVGERVPTMDMTPYADAL